MHFACYDKDLVIHLNRSCTQALAKLDRQTGNIIQRMRWLVLTKSCDMLCFRIHGGMDYNSDRNNISCSTIEEWTGMVCLACDAWVWQKAQLRVEFHYLRKTGGFWGGCEDDSI